MTLLQKKPHRLVSGLFTLSLALNCAPSVARAHVAAPSSMNEGGGTFEEIGPDRCLTSAEASSAQKAIEAKERQVAEIKKTLLTAAGKGAAYGGVTVILTRAMIMGFLEARPLIFPGPLDDKLPNGPRVFATILYGSILTAEGFGVYNSAKAVKFHFAKVGKSVKKLDEVSAQLAALKKSLTECPKAL